MLAVSTDESWAPVRDFFRTQKPELNILLDKNGDIAEEYGTQKFPETYLVLDGEIIGYIVGPRNWDKWYAEAYLKALLERRT